MPRPPVEWPIPQYVAEIRERVIATFRVPAPVVAALVPAPLSLSLASGEAAVSLALSACRCLKPVGGVAVLATEFHTAELITPVTWRRACGPSLKGQCLLRFFTDRAGVARLVGAALGFPADRAGFEQRPERDRTVWRLAAGEAGAGLLLPRPAVEAAWPADSAFSSHEAAEAALAHPERCFVPSGGGRAVFAAPVHQYARSTTCVTPDALSAPVVAACLGARPEEVVPDHVFVQKRCTLTFAYPPERMLTIQRSVSAARVRIAAGATR